MCYLDSHVLQPRPLNLHCSPDRLLYWACNLIENLLDPGYPHFVVEDFLGNALPPLCRVLKLLLAESVDLLPEFAEPLAE